MQYSKYPIPAATKIHEIECICGAIEIQTTAVITTQLKMCFHMMCKSSMQINITHYETQIIIIIICTVVKKWTHSNLLGL